MATKQVIVEGIGGVMGTVEVDEPSGAEVTAGLAQFDGNHFAIFNDSSASFLYVNFLWSQLRDGPPGEIGGSFP